jgi:NADPH-dependent 2,4-dienoyl-CoA reductase/sulfur reductase-like enzyme
MALAITQALPVSVSARSMGVPHEHVAHSEQLAADVVVYGSTPAGIMAAVAAGRSGASVVLISPTATIGGMMSNGLSWTDRGDLSVIGGLASEFFDRTEVLEGASGGRWAFRPSTADTVFA